MSDLDNPYDMWAHECDKAKNSVLSCEDFENVGDLAIDRAKRLGAIAYKLKGIACESCSGYGTKDYYDVKGICELCWGTGNTESTGFNLKKAKSQALDGLAQLSEAYEDLKEANDHRDILIVAIRTIIYDLGYDEPLNTAKTIAKKALYDVSYMDER